MTENTTNINSSAITEENPDIWDFPTEGELPFKMTNDYLFKLLLQSNEKVLRGLICSLLHLQPQDITSTDITNAILLGKSITDKTFMLDVKIILNNEKSINLEMQVINNSNWPERSLAYLCRDFDAIACGNDSDYADIKPVHQIGILDYTPFKDYPEFYATYLMKNVKNDHVYSDKFKISVLDLTQIDIATDEDKEFRIDYWARFFSAKRWEDLYMLAKENNIMADATHTIHYLTGDELIREQMFQREEYLKHEAYTQGKLADTEEALHNAEVELIKKDDIIAEKDNTIAEKDNAIAKKDALIIELQRQLAEATKENKALEK